MAKFYEETDDEAFEEPLDIPGHKSGPSALFQRVGVQAGGVDVADTLKKIQLMTAAQRDEVQKQLLLEAGDVGIAKMRLEALAHALNMDGVDSNYNPWTEGLIRASEMSDDAPTLPIWFFIYEEALILFNGQSGAGKSTCLANIMIHLCQGLELWGEPVRKNQVILALDPENRGAVRRKKCISICETLGIALPDSLFFHDAIGKDLSDPRMLKYLRSLIKDNGITGVVLDPLANLYNTVNENDNAEASRQMRGLNDIIAETGAWVLAAHHTGKGDDTQFRGASARGGAAYVIVDLRLAKDGEEENDERQYYRKDEEGKERTDAVRLLKHKDRFNGRRESLYLRMSGGDMFERINFREWTDAKNATAGGGLSAADKAEQFICAFFEKDEFKTKALSREPLIDAIRNEFPGAPGRNMIDSALGAMSTGPLATLNKFKEGKFTYYHRADLTRSQVTTPGDEAFDGVDDEREAVLDL
jgi:hypothetical protein